MNPNFEQVGKHVELGDVSISQDDADRFRHAALQGAKIHKLFIGDSSTYIWTASYATGVLAQAASDYEVDERAFYAKSVAGQDPHFWRSVITFARFNQKHADTKIYNIYEVEAQGGELLTAVRKVRIIRNLTRIAFDENGEPTEDIYSRQRKGFEVPMQPEDVDLVVRDVERIVNRQRVTTPRK